MLKAIYHSCNLFSVAFRHVTHETYINFCDPNQEKHKNKWALGREKMPKNYEAKIGHHIVKFELRKWRYVWGFIGQQIIL